MACWTWLLKSGRRARRRRRELPTNVELAQSAGKTKRHGRGIRGNHWASVVAARRKDKAKRLPMTRDCRKVSAFGGTRTPDSLDRHGLHLLPSFIDENHAPRRASAREILLFEHFTADGDEETVVLLGVIQGCSQKAVPRFPFKGVVGRVTHDVAPTKFPRLERRRHPKNVIQAAPLKVVGATRPCFIDLLVVFRRERPWPGLEPNGPPSAGTKETEAKSADEDSSAQNSLRENSARKGTPAARNAS